MAKARHRRWLYNRRSELAAATVGADSYGYAYDSIGNRLWSAANAVTNSYTANCLNQYTAVSAGANPVYDADGNMTGDGKKAEILVLDGCIVGDYDRKDGFTNHDLSRVYRNKPLRHWINDDDDSGDVNEGDEDIPGLRDPSWWGAMKYAVGIGKEPDYYNDHVDGKCDILDFTPVWIDMGFALQQLTNLFEGSSASDYVLTLSQPESAVN
ncbi:MAG: hypothetical protein IJI36_06465, partial [Kiritimatiellae bacterium]|nr:hypothetical protein [Kiritimatiellia bacterium]